MPPKRRGGGPGQRLLFVEPSRDGRLHRWGSPPRAAHRPRGTAAGPAHQLGPSWITAHFESATSVGFQRWHRKCPNLKNKNSSLVMERGKRATAHKFLPLEFENVRTSPCAGEISRCPVDCCAEAGHFAEMHPKQPPCTSFVASISPTIDGSGACLEDNSHCPLPSYADPLAFSPPDTCTLEHPSSINACSECLPHVNSFTPDPKRSLVFGDPSSGGDVSVLVQDTPEHEYGVRVTWRRRSLLMKYLREKGVLSTADTFVQTELVLSS